MRKTFEENFHKTQQERYILLDYKSKNAVKIKCALCGEETVVASTSLTQYVIPCKKCKEIKDEQKRLAAEELSKLYEQNNILESLTLRLNKAYKKCLSEVRKKEKRKQYEKIHELKRENRIKNNGRIDKDITLEKLYERDKKRCYICGCYCDYSDHTTKNGYFITGLTYPTIDHVIPLSKGGTHTWDNVKLACMLCNSTKGNLERIPRRGAKAAI